jgi:hypothetical protein
MKHVLAFLLIFATSSSALAEDLPKFSCSIQDSARVALRTEDFNDLSLPQLIFARIPAQQIDVYATVSAIKGNSRIRIYTQITHKDQNVLIGGSVGYFDVHSQTMEIEVDSMQGTTYGATVYCEKR